MTDAEKADLKRLAENKSFQRFMYETIRAAGVMTVAPLEGRSLEFIEGRRSLALDMLGQLEQVQDTQSPDGLPLFTSIQIFLNVAQSASKEKPLGGRSDPYRDLGDDTSE